MYFSKIGVYIFKHDYLGMRLHSSNKEILEYFLNRPNEEMKRKLTKEDGKENSSQTFL